MKKSKKCSYCHVIKLLDYFHKDRTITDKHANRCISCTKLYYKTYYQKKSDRKSHFMYESLEDPNYLKDKRDLFRLHKNGWWFEDKTRYRGRRKPK